MNILNINKLEKFDILLVRFPDDETSKKIRDTCGSNFSHAVIYLGNGSFIEGVDPIVSLFSVNRYYFETLDDVQVLRLNKELKAKLNQDETENFIRSLAFCNYSRRLLYFIEKKNIDKHIIDTFNTKNIWEGGIVCTSLITLPYYVGGIDISKNNEPFYAHFGDIEKYEGFVDVTSTVFKELQPEELDDDMFDYFTTIETGSLLEKQSHIAKKLNLYVQDKYRDILKNPQNYDDIVINAANLGFSTWEDIYPNIMRWFQTKTGQMIDNELSNLITSLGYNQLWFEEIHKNKEQYFPLYYESSRHSKDLEFLRNTLQSTLDRIRESVNFFV